MKLTLAIVSLLLIFQSCSSKRVHEKPNFSLTGKAAQKEYEKFKISHMRSTMIKFESEGFFTQATGEEAKTFVKSISKTSASMINETRNEENIYWGLFGAWIATAFMRGHNGGTHPLWWAGAAVTIGYGVYLNDLQRDAVDQYNQDLKGQFAPSVGYTFEY